MAVTISLVASNSVSSLAPANGYALSLPATTSAVVTLNETTAAETTCEATTEVETTTEKSTQETAKKNITKAPKHETEYIHYDTGKPNQVFYSLDKYKNTYIPISELEVPDDVKVDSKGRPKNYSYKYEAKATAYTGDAYTASGRKPMAGHIAVDPNEFPYGTELYITSADGKYVYGYCVAADTGGFVKMGNTDVDLYFNTEDMCYDWGNRDIIIYVL